MLTFDEIISKCDDDMRHFIECQIEHARTYMQRDNYAPRFDDITPDLFQAIGNALFNAVYPPQPQNEEEQETFNPPDGALAFYCRSCEKPRVFLRDGYHAPKCSVCGNPRHKM